MHIHQYLRDLSAKFCSYRSSNLSKHPLHIHDIHHFSDVVAAWIVVVHGIIPCEKPSVCFRPTFKNAPICGFFGDRDSGSEAGIGSERVSGQRQPSAQHYG